MSRSISTVRRWAGNVAVGAVLAGVLALTTLVADGHLDGRIVPRSLVAGIGDVAPPPPVGPHLSDVASAPLLAWIGWYPLAYVAVSALVAVPLATYLLVFASPLDDDGTPSLTEGGFDLPLPDDVGAGLLDADDLALLVFLVAAVLVVLVAIVVGYALVLVGATLLSRRWGLRGLGLSTLVGDAVWGVTVVLEPNAVFLNRAAAIGVAAVAVVLLAAVVGGVRWVYPRAVRRV